MTSWGYARVSTVDQDTRPQFDALRRACQFSRSSAPVIVVVCTAAGVVSRGGAGKSTTIRLILGLDRPTSGHALVNGRNYTRSQAPISEIGALLDAHNADKARSARDHLRAIGATVGFTSARVDEVLEVVGLTDVARQKAGSFSLGMGQRLGIAAALLGDPKTVMLDEPVNGLDPDGILWIRNLLKELASEGRTVLLSSHLMSEMELTAEHLLVIGRGRIMADMPIHQFIAQATGNHVHVVTPDGSALRDLLAAPGVAVESAAPGVLDIEGLTAREIGTRAAAAGLVLFELTPIEPSLEEAFMTMTRDAVEFHGSATHPHLELAAVGAADKDAA